MPKLSVNKQVAISLRKRINIFLSGIFLFFIAGIEAEKTSAQSDLQIPKPVAAASGGADKPKITLRDVIRQVEINHPKLGGAIIERRIAEAKVVEKQGAFDPVINASSDFLRYNSTTTPGKASLAFQNQGAVEWTTRSGMKFFAGSRINFGKVKSPLSATGETGEYFAGVAMPLFRDRGVNAKSTAEQQAIIGVDVAETNVAATRLDLVRAASESYWNWVAARQKLQINANLFEIARERANQIGTRVMNGDLPQIDSTEASLEVQRRMGNIVKSRQELQKAAFKLGLYLWRSDGSPEPTPEAENAPDKFPTPNPLTDFIVREGVERALKNNPELQKILLTRRQSDLDARLARNNSKPRVDLYLAPGQDTGFASAGTTFKFGATVELPLRTRTAEGQLASARLKIEKLNLEEQLKRQAVTTDVLNAAQAVNAAHDGYLLALQELNLARTLEQGERSRFAVGDSTLFLVNQRERATAEAQIKLIEIQATYEQALVNFKIATTEY